MAELGKCAAQRKDGKPCSAPALPSGRYCFAHDPACQAKTAAGRAAGGRATRKTQRATRLMPDRLRPVLEALERGIGNVEDGTMRPAQLVAIASAASAVVKVYTVGQLEERVRDLEQSRSMRQSG